MISVCLAAFNGEAFLEEQMLSILSQLSQEDELILSDDGSTDNTMAIVKSFAKKDPRIKCIAGPKKGVTANFGAAIAEAKGEYIFLADQDDVWLPEKVAATLALFQQSPQTLVVISDLKIVDENLQVLYPSYFAYRQVQAGFFKNILKNKYIGAGMAFKKELTARILPIPAKIPMHDMWIGLLAGRKVALLKQPLTLYRRHGKNASEIETTSSFKQKVIWRYYLVINLIKRMVFKKA